VENPQATDRSPNPIDISVGERIRARRKIIGMSQEALGDELGLTFQQVQKYERGANRVSASKLYAMAKVMQTPISYFFGDLPDPCTDAAPVSDGAFTKFAGIPGARELAQRFPLLDERRRHSLVQVARALDPALTAADVAAGQITH